jgi:predicted transcriptional regulator
MKRSELHLIHDVLAACRKPSNCTRIMYDTNTTHKHLMCLIRKLVRRGFLLETQKRGEVKTLLLAYVLSDEGSEFLRRLDGVLCEV